MDRLLKKAVFTVLGVALTLGVWTVRGWFEGSASAESASHIPAKVWSGGGGPVVLEAETSEAGTVSATFETNLQVDDPNHRYLETWQKVEAGHHTFTIDVPANTSGTVEVGIEKPGVGARVRVALRVNGQVAAEDIQTLDSPLQPGYGFFAQVHLEDYATGKLGED